jgi:hypothetical protein
MPPYLAGRESQFDEFRKVANQDVILENLIVTGLRGVGKTVLMEKLKPIAQGLGWLWVGSDFSESAGISEDHLATRLLTDLAVQTSNVVVGRNAIKRIGFHQPDMIEDVTMNYRTLQAAYRNLPGLAADRLKALLEMAWSSLVGTGARGIIFAYDEAQNMADRREKEQYPLSVFLETFQSIQRKEIPIMLVLAGLPTLFPKLVEARTFAERMFHVMELKRLDDKASREAIVIPMDQSKQRITFSEETVDMIVRESGGYPYFIQFICREFLDAAFQNFLKLQPGQQLKHENGELVSLPDIVHKLDSDFFAGRWARTTDRQRDLLILIAMLDHCDSEFTVQEIVEQSNRTPTKPFSPSRVSQLLNALSNSGLIYKNRHGRYSFAVPLMGEFIRRKIAQSEL